MITLFIGMLEKNPEGNPRIHILSENKRINLEFAPFDSEYSNHFKYVFPKGAA